MIQLKTKFISSADGFGYNPLLYEQLQRTERVALYRRSRDHSTQDFLDFEVFRVRIGRKGAHIFEAIRADDKELYPKGTQFGFTAWTYHTRKGAEARFAELVELSKAHPVEVVVADEDDDDAPETPAMALPANGFTIAQYATRTGLPYPQAYIKLQEAIDRGEFRKSHAKREEGKKGRATNFYVEVNVDIAPIV